MLPPVRAAYSSVLEDGDGITSLVEFGTEVSVAHVDDGVGEGFGRLRDDDFSSEERAVDVRSFRWDDGDVGENRECCAVGGCRNLMGSKDGGLLMQYEEDVVCKTTSGEKPSSYEDGHVPWTAT